jgi:hypothetical protein
MTRLDAAEEALLNAGMSASDAGMPLAEAIERVKAAYTQAAIERGDDEQTEQGDNDND